MNLRELQHELESLALRVGDLEDAQNPEVLQKWPNLANKEHISRLEGYIRHKYQTLKDAAIILAANGVTLHGEESARDLRKYARRLRDA